MVDPTTSVTEVSDTLLTSVSTSSQLPGVSSVALSSLDINTTMCFQLKYAHTSSSLLEDIYND